jgi:hypothetical protein
MVEIAVVGGVHFHVRYLSRFWWVEICSFDVVDISSGFQVGMSGEFFYVTSLSINAIGQIKFLLSWC